MTGVGEWKEKKSVQFRTVHYSGMDENHHLKSAAQESGITTYLLLIHMALMEKKYHFRHEDNEDQKIK